MIDTEMIDTIELKNGRMDAAIENLYYPRLQINQNGEIVLAVSKHKTLTTGILVGKTSTSKTPFKIGTKFSDWEVGGELEDYDGEVVIRIKNMNKS